MECHLLMCEMNEHRTYQHIINNVLLISYKQRIPGITTVNIARVVI